MKDEKKKIWYNMFHTPITKLKKRVQLTLVKHLEHATYHKTATNGFKLYNF